jgi:hypothetical protein
VITYKIERLANSDSFANTGVFGTALQRAQYNENAGYEVYFTKSVGN